jgi:hypothetical protein
MASIPVAFAFGWLTYAQLVVVAVVVAAGDITFQAAAGAYLKRLVPPDALVVANGRFESTNWSATAVGPPLGGAAMGVFGPVTMVAVDAVSYLLSAAGIRAIGDTEPPPGRAASARPRVRDLADGWRYAGPRRRAPAPQVLLHRPRAHFTQGRPSVKHVLGL